MTAEQSAVLNQIARGQAVSAWPTLSKEQARDLEKKAEAYFRDYRRYHQPYGTTADILFANDSRSSVEMLDGIGDSATWTGHYLAALAFRYSVTRESALLDEIRKALDAYEVLAHVTGRDGYIARFARPAQDEAYRRYYRGHGGGPDPARPGLRTWAYRGAGRYSDLVWLNNSSGRIGNAVRSALRLPATAALGKADGQQHANGYRPLHRPARAKVGEICAADPRTSAQRLHVAAVAVPPDRQRRFSKQPGGSCALRP